MHVLHFVCIGVSDQLYAPADLSPLKKPKRPTWVGCVDPRTCFIIVAKRKLPLPAGNRPTLLGPQPVTLLSLISKIRIILWISASSENEWQRNVVLHATYPTLSFLFILSAKEISIQTAPKSIYYRK
jgi:hypothetical protein